VIVLDASAAVEVIAKRAQAKAIASRLAQDFAVFVPAVFDLEVLQALRALDRAGKLPAPDSGVALRDLEDLRAVRYGHELLRTRIWALRNNLTAYDAAYVALAELLDATLITCDAALARSSGHAARIELV
jgi:predicted nucleic acid-binding protein